MYIYHIFDVPIVTTRIVYAFYYTYSNMQLTNEIDIDLDYRKVDRFIDKDRKIDRQIDR